MNSAVQDLSPGQSAATPAGMDYVRQLARYRSGVWRDRILHDVVLADALRRSDRPTILDIGCGRGLDGDVPLQQSIADKAGTFIGVEPDRDVPIGSWFDVVHRSLLEDAPIPPGTVDVAYAVMVLEHLETPAAFFDTVHRILAPGGVFWGMTVDSRHRFCKVSTSLDRLGLKERYLGWLLGARGEERYENYPVFYRCNEPAAIEPYVQSFRSAGCWNLSRVGQCDGYVPRLLRPVAAAVDRFDIARGRPGTLLMTRLEKA
jgi:SAM-dependent methyltransferase